jgi:DNA-binding NarL/FixJ family response regulator
MEQIIRVAILDDHQAIIDGCRYRLADAPDITVVAALRYGCELEPALAATPCDLLLLDINVPAAPDNHNPFPVLHLMPKLLKQYPALSILILSMHAETELIKATMAAGAGGYLLKEDAGTMESLANIIRSVAGGNIYLSQKAQRRWQTPAGKPLPLTPRQLELLSLLSANPGLTLVATAEQLKVSPSTVRNQLSNIYLRLGVSNRTEAILQARRAGLVTTLVEAPVERKEGLSDGSFGFRGTDVKRDA